MNNISIQVPSITENIRMIESFIDNAKERFHLDEDLYGNIMIAVTEAVNNAIKHGNASDKSKNVSLSLSLDESLLKFTIILITRTTSILSMMGCIPDSIWNIFNDTQRNTFGSSKPIFLFLLPLFKILGIWCFSCSNVISVLSRPKEVTG